MIPGPDSPDLAVRLARFGQALRQQGLGTSLRDEIDAADALICVDREDRQEVRHTLRIALKIPRQGFDIFDRLLGVFWSGQQVQGQVPPPPTRPEPSRPTGPPLRWDAEARRLVTAGAASETSGDQPGYSPEALLRRKPFDQVSGARDRAAMERLLQRLARRLRARPGRRLVPTRGRGRPDLRASFRRALGTSGELLRLSRRAPALVEPRLVFLCDTSGSMDAHTRFLLTFALAVRRAIPRAEVFAFNTQLHHLSPALSPGRLELTLDRLAAAVPDWSGGTRIGGCLQTFADQHLDRLVDPRTTVIVLSDGLDRGDPAELAGAVARIRGRARALIWLNPLLGDPRYQPIAAGMQAAMPFVDHLAAAHNLESLERILPHLHA